MPKQELEMFWACVKIYVPFVMGGNVWQFRRYPVVGHSMPFAKRDGFVWLKDGRWQLHDKLTGFFLCDGGDAASAVKKGEKLLAITPDFAKQAEELGKAENHELITYDKAMELLARNPKGDKEYRKELDDLLKKERKDAAGKHGAGRRGRSKDRAGMAAAHW